MSNNERRNKGQFYTPTLFVDYAHKMIAEQFGEARKEYCKKWICEHSDYYPLADFCACNCDCCCNKKSKLLSPNKYQQLYSTPRKNTNLK